MQRSSYQPMWDHGNAFCISLVRPDISPHKHLGIWRNPRCTSMGFHRMLWNTSRLFWISIETHENLFNRTACEVTPIRLDKTQFSLLFPLGFYRRLWNTSLLFWISIKTHQNLFNRMIYEITPTSLDETQFLSSFFPQLENECIKGAPLIRRIFLTRTLFSCCEKIFVYLNIFLSYEEVYECISNFSQEVLQ